MAADRRAKQARAMDEGTTRAREIAYEQSTLPQKMRDKRSPETIAMEELAAGQDVELSKLMEQRRKLVAGIREMQRDLDIKPTEGDKKAQADYQKKEGRLLAAELQLREMDRRKESLFDDRDRRARQMPESQRLLIPFSKEEREQLASKTPGMREAVAAGAAAGAADETLAAQRRESVQRQLDFQTELKYKSKPEFTSVQEFWKSFSAKLVGGDADMRHKQELAKNTAEAAKAGKDLLEFLRGRANKPGGLPEE
jgi:hypothetical protein